MKTLLLVLASLSVVAVPVVVVTQYQEAPAQFYGHLQASIGTVPAANGCWSQVLTEKGPYTGIHSVSLSGVDCSGATGRFAILTDITVYWQTSNQSAFWWVRDQNTGTVLWASRLAPNPTSSVVIDVQHFQTPLVFSVGPLPPRIELGSYDQLVSGFVPFNGGSNTYFVSALGRYVMPN